MPNPFSRPVTLALERGYFEDGLEVTTFRNGSALAEALTRGEVDVGVGGHLQTLGAGGQVFVGPLGFERAPDHLPIALVASRDDLEGAAVGVSARAAISELQLRIFLGPAYETVTLVPMPFGELAGAFRRGEIQAASAPDPFAAQLVEEGLGRIVDRGSLSRALPDGARVMIAGLAATRAGAEPAKRLVDAIGRAIDELRDVPAPPGQHVPHFDRALEPADLQLVCDLAFEHGLVERRVDAAELLF